MLDGNVEQTPEGNLNALFYVALDTVAKLPFALILDKWRWEVFSGTETTKENWNKRWWQLRAEYQGIIPPVERTEEHLDPASKYHVSANEEYIG